MSCPACGAGLEERAVAGEVLRACSQCDGLLVTRAVMARLRARRDEMEGALLGAGADGPADALRTTGSKGVASRPCPSCRRAMHGYAYGGGHVRVESCDACEHLFFDRGELRAVLEEARNGIAMSDEAKGLLYTHRVVATQARAWQAEVGLSVIGLVAVYVFLHLALELGMTAVALTVGAAVTLVGYLAYRRQLEREQRGANERLDRLRDAEAWRLDQAARAASATAKPDPAKVGTARAGSAVTGSAKVRSCPFCAAPLAAGRTHCAGCDSDFG